MKRKTRHLLCLCATSALVGVYCVGLLNTFSFLVALGFAALSAVLFGWLGKPLVLANILLLTVSIGFTLTAAELVLRATYSKHLYYRPHDMLIQRRPRYPHVSRYRANTTILRNTYGDLAAMANDVELRENRSIEFVTDEHGFRNRPPTDDTVYDVVILGDSFAAGNGTTQDRTWVSLLGSRHGLAVYNLALPGSPWHSSVNLALEVDRLRVRPGGTILLTVFSGNDLDEEYGQAITVGLKLNNTFETTRQSLLVYRNRSVIRKLLQRRFRPVNNSGDSVVTRRFGDGESILFYEPYVGRKDRTKEQILKHPNYPKLVGSLKAIGEIAKSRSASFKIVSIPSKAEIYSWIVDNSDPWSSDTTVSGFAEAMREFCHTNEIGFLDLKLFLSAQAKEEYENSQQLLWWSDDTHWNHKGHNAVADIVYWNLLEESNSAGSSE